MVVQLTSDNLLNSSASLVVWIYFFSVLMCYTLIHDQQRLIYKCETKRGPQSRRNEMQKHMEKNYSKEHV